MSDAEGRSDPTTTVSSPLVEAYLHDRDDLVRYFAARLRSRCEAEDLVQELGRRLIELRPADGLENPSAYLHRIAHNLMLDRRRSAGRAQRRDDAVIELRHSRTGSGMIADEPSPEEAVTAREALRRLLGEVARLPAKPRLAFELHKLRGHSHAETARLMGISRSGVEKHVMTALKLLTTRLP